jgi:HK97 family phage portal protein
MKNLYLLDAAFNNYVAVYKNPVVYTCVNFVARSVASINFDIESDQDEIFLSKMFKKPNSNETMKSILHKIVCDLLIEGCAYLEREISKDDNGFKVISGLYYVSQDDEQVKEYNLQNKQNLRDRKYKVSAKNILKIDYPMHVNCKSTPPGHIVLEHVRLYNAIENYNRSFLENSAKFHGIIELNDFHNNFDFDALVEKLRVNPPGRPLILQNCKADLKHIKNDFSYNADAHIHVVKQIVRAFGVHPILLGLQESNGQHQYESAHRHFWQDVVIPLAVHIGEIMENWFSARYSGMKIKWRFSEIDALYNSWYERAAKIDGLSFLTQDEKRNICQDLLNIKSEHVNDCRE